MNISKYEAAALYHYASLKSQSNINYLVMDLDDCSYGFCSCSNDNNTRLHNSSTIIKINLWEECLKAIKTTYGQALPSDLETELLAQLSMANSAFHNYYLSDKAINSEAFSFAGLSITCEKLEANLDRVSSLLQELISYITQQISEEKLLNTRILLIGQAQEFFPVQHRIREHLSFDPFLPDERFKNSELQAPASDIVRLGNELLKSMKLLKHSYFLSEFNRESNKLETICLGKKGTSKTDLKDLVFSAPLFILRDEKLKLKADDRSLEIELPFSFAPQPHELIQAAVGLQDNKDTLFIRRYLFPAQIFSVELR